MSNRSVLDRRWASLLAAGFVVGCAAAPQPLPAAGTQSFRDAMRMFCEVDRLAGLSDEELVDVGGKRTEWLQAHVDNPDGIELRTLLSVKTPAEQAALLRDKAKAVGIQGCALADSLDRTGMGAISP